MGDNGTVTVNANYSVGSIYIGSSAATAPGNGTVVVGTTAANKTLTVGGTLYLGNASHAGTLKLGGSGAFGGTIVLGPGGIVTAGTPTLALNGTSAVNTIDTNGNNVTYASVISDLGTNNTFFKAGNGTLTLSAANTYAGPTTIGGGTLVLSNTTLASSGSDPAKRRRVPAVGAVIQNFNTLTVGVGGGSIVPDPTGTVNFNTSVTATTVGGGLLVNAGPTGIVTVPNAPDATGIYGGRMVYFDGTNYNWAASPGYSFRPATLSGYTLYSPLNTTAGGGTDALNSQITGTATLGGNVQTNTLSIAPTAPTTLHLGGYALTLNGGGLLVTGANAVTIGDNASDTLTAGSATIGSTDELIIQQYSTAPLTINASIVTNPLATSTALTKAGSGTTILNGTNTYTGKTTVAGGTLVVPSIAECRATALAATSRYLPAPRYRSTTAVQTTGPRAKSAPPAFSTPRP